MAITNTSSARDDIGKLILRLTVAVLLGFHGVAKLRHGIGWIEDRLHAHHLPTFVAYGVYLGEVVAPVLLILGILTRPAALLIAFDLCMALFLVFQDKAFQIDPRTGALGGELQFLFIFSSLAIVFLGSGRFALSKGLGRWD